ncbi:MAG: cytidylate kinase-like family protein [Deltaproteobacteria bacterium]|nr:cytidylate kinase-like family protein [Deltaproteobacteria bacterium]
MAVVTISRQFGAGAMLLGERLCEKTGFNLVDENILNEVARKEKISTEWLDAIEKESASNALYLLTSIVSKGFFYRTPGLPADEAERKRYLDVLTRIMTGMADKGEFVIIGRGAQFILKDHPKAIHILLISDYERRVSLVSENLKLTTAEAKELIREKEKQRSHLAKNIFKKNMDDSVNYHLVINTGRVSLEKAVNILSSMLEDPVRHVKGA